MFWTVQKALTTRAAAMLHKYGKQHHDDEGHGVKVLEFPRLALLLHNKLQNSWPFGNYIVDPKMAIYRLDVNAPPVAQHIDEDFDGPWGSRARYSVLVKLNKNYKGGDTVFCGNMVAHMDSGDAVVFPHGLLHEARAVESGVKYTLKTDIFC